MGTLLEKLSRCPDGWITEIKDFRHTAYGVMIPGTDSGPDPAALALAEHVLAKADEAFDDGSAYLRYFISLEHIGCKGEWELLGFDFHAPASIPAASFVVEFGLWADVYGFWTVAFLVDKQSGKPRPMAFGRRQD